MAHNTPSTESPPLPDPIPRHPLIQASLPFLIGGASGMAATTCLQPVDMVKVRIQLDGEGSAAVRGTKPSPWSLARGIVANEGVLSLCNGLSAGLARQAVYTTARLGFFDLFLRACERRAVQRGTSVTFAERAASGIVAGALGAFIGNPTEVALIRMQSDGLRPIAERANYRSVVDALLRVGRSEGIRALWNGSSPTVIRAMSTNFGQLAFFSESKNQLGKRTSLGPRMQSVVGSGIAGFFASLFSLPFDFMKTRLQRQVPAKDGTLPYKGMLDCLVKVARTEGWMRFYRGFGTYFVRIAPHTIITLIVADNLHMLLKR